MNQHFDEYLNIRGLIVKHRPELVVELGARGGDHSRKLVDFMKEGGFGRLVVVTDGPLGGTHVAHEADERFVWVEGISFRVLRGWSFGPIGCAIVDTDHNYYTLKEELAALYPLMAAPGLIMLHDTVSYNDGSGKQTSYHTKGERYPSEEIGDCEKLGKRYGDAWKEFLMEHGEYELIAESDEACGAVALALKPCAGS